MPARLKSLQPTRSPLQLAAAIHRVGVRMRIQCAALAAAAASDGRLRMQMLDAIRGADRAVASVGRERGRQATPAVDWMAVGPAGMQRSAPSHRIASLTQHTARLSVCRLTVEAAARGNQWQQQNKQTKTDRFANELRRTDKHPMQAHLVC